MTRNAVDAARADAPAGIDIHVLEDLAAHDLQAVDFLVPPSDATSDLLGLLPRLTNLAVVQVLSAGTDWIEERVPVQATLCSARGARDRPVAEWILAALLGASSQLLACAHTTTWTVRHNQDLGTATVLVVGMGSIGRTLQRYLEPLGTTVIGVASRARRNHPATPGHATPGHATPSNDVHGVDELNDLLPQADAVVILTPLTNDTRGLIGRAQLSRMRDGALLVNAGRGPVVDTTALLHELRHNRLRAVLDVTDPEPLPDGHPLWTAPGVLSITPHIAGDSPAGHARAAALAGEQLRRWANNEPLHNVVRAGRR